MEFEERQQALREAILENKDKGSSGAEAVVGLLVKLRPPAPAGEADKEEKGAWQAKRAALDQEVEVALREVLLELRDKPGVNLVDPAQFPFAQLLDLALALCVHPNGIRAIRAPFLLMEAVLDTATPQQITELWGVVEKREDRIDQVFSKSGILHKLMLLKVCNGLLRRLSRKLHSSLTGRIDQFMGRTWSLSEPSAVNRAGNANVDNVTTFDDEDDFKRQQEADREKAGEEFMDTDDGRIKDGQAVDFDQYRNFWSLQKYLSDPKATVDKNWDEFTKAAEVVMTSLEGYSVSSDNVGGGKEATNAEARGGSLKKAKPRAAGVPKGEYMGLKYLTNSRLFHLQLRDPLVRLQVLTQVCIIANHARMASGKDERFGVSELIKQAKKLMKATPGGREYASMLDLVLYREQRWFDWKANKCVPPIERAPDVDLKELAADKQVVESLHKATQNTPVITRQVAGQFGAKLYLPPLVDPSSVMEANSAAQKTFDNYIRVKYEEAEDPENCIDAECHPKNDLTFNQRAVRLAARAKEVRGFEILEEGTVVAVMEEYLTVLNSQLQKARGDGVTSNGHPEPTGMDVEADPAN